MTEEMICGIEIHQQLDTKKLFCSCETRLVEEEGVTLLRRLRPTQSEMGEIDRAALVQAERRMRFRYQAPRSVSCLVDADEEPPHDADEDAMDITLTVASLMHAQGRGRSPFHAQDRHRRLEHRRLPAHRVGGDGRLHRGEREAHRHPVDMPGGGRGAQGRDQGLRGHLSAGPFGDPV